MIRLGHGGSIVNIASMLGLTAQAKRPSYCAAKAGVIHLSRAMALELAPHKIRVNAIAPGFFESEMTHDYLVSNAGQRHGHAHPDEAHRRDRRAGRRPAAARLTPPAT